MRVYDLKTEYRIDPIGIDAAAPRFSWKLKSEKRSVMQRSYRILACTKPDENALLWMSDQVESGQSQHVLWQGPALRSRQRVYWKVQVEAGNGEMSESAESDWVFFEMGLLSPQDWRAQWIEPGEQDAYQTYQAAPYLRRSFTVKPGLTQARIYQTAHGLYEFWINGAAGTQDKFKPGFTSYHRRLAYQVYDVTDLLHEGENIWAVALGDGWWRGKMGGTTRNNFGYKLQFLGQLELTYWDGSREIIGTDESFRYAYGGIRKCDIRDGEIFDARVEPEGWKRGETDEIIWKPVLLGHDDNCRKDQLIASRSVPVREHESFRAKSFRDKEGNLILDFGQNMAGIVHMTLRGCKPGQEIILTHGEDIKDGVFSLENLLGGMFEQDGFQEVRYIAKGEQEEHFAPTFSVFGFRYVKLEGYEGHILPDDFIATAIYSDLEETGDFTCSHALINQLVKNSRWSQKSNYLDVPTDCPTRERSPWTGDSQVYCRTAADFMNVYPFFEKWMEEFTCDQMKSGKLRSTIPSGSQNQAENERTKKAFFDRIADQKDLSVEDQMILMMYSSDSEEKGVADGSAGWSDAAVINPWTMYLCYGDPQILKNQFSCMKKHVDYMFAKAKNHNPLREGEREYHHETDGELDADYIWDTEFHWGEWLEADIGTAGEMAVMMQKFMNPDPEVPTMFLYYSMRLYSEIAQVLDLPEEAAIYAARAEKVKRAFNRYFIHADGSIKAGRQAPNVRALAFGLCDEEHHEAVLRNLTETIHACNDHLNTGFLATPYLLNVLADNGESELAYRLLEQEDAPSWLYNVKKGATTILEEWCGMDTHAGSFNHYSYGAVCDFLFSRTAGIRPLWDKPGYQEFVLEPVIGGTLTYAEALYESLYGTIRSRWELNGDVVSYFFDIPENTHAQIRLPGSESDLSTVGEMASDAKWDHGMLLFTLGSGHWSISVKK